MTASELKKSILKYAIEGKLTEQSEKDEPAEELLKRIKKEKEKLIKDGRIKKGKTASEIYKKDGSYYERVSDGKNILKDVCIDEELPFEIPDTWTWCRIGNIGAIIRGNGIKRSDVVESGFSCVRYGEIYTTYNISFKETVSNIPEEIFKKSKCFSYGDVLMTLTGENKEDIAKAVVYLGDSKVAASGDLAFWTNHKMEPLFISYLMNSPYAIYCKSKLATGDIIVHISASKLESILIPIPPIEEQKRIAEKINLLMPLINEYDELEKSITKLNKEFPNNIKKSILKYAIEGKLTKQSEKDEPAEEILKRIKKEKEKLIKDGRIKKGKTASEIYKKDGSYYERVSDGKNILKDVCIDDELPFNLPDSWVWVRLGELCTIINGFTPLRSNNKFWDNPTIPWFTVEDIHNQGRRIYKTLQAINESALSNNSTRILPAKTVLLCCTASVGEYAITEIPLTTNQQFNGLVINEYWKKYCTPEFIFTIAPTFKSYLFQVAGKTTFNFISVKKLSELLIPLPPIEEQKRIAEKINSLNEIVNTIKI